MSKDHPVEPRGTNQTSASLLARLCEPDAQDAWARFVELYTPLLYYWARRLGLPAQDTADLVRDVLTLLVQKLPEFRYERGKSFRAWLRTVALNKWRENQRRRAAVPTAGLEALSAVAGPQEPEFLEEAEYRRHLVGRALQLMQAGFQPATWKACWECTVNGRPAAEVARELGVTVEVVYAAKSRVLRRLREELADLLD
jgi:RNA polymerase sigma-70 factor (ECF subfamily)